MLEKLKQSKSIRDFVRNIRSIHNSESTVDYIPAIIEEGRFTLEEGEDFYSKLCFTKEHSKVDYTWMSNNSKANNLIERVRHKEGFLYEISPILRDMNRDYITFSDIKDNLYFDYLLINEGNGEGTPIIKIGDTINKVYVHRKVISKNDIMYKNKVIIEFELRVRTCKFASKTTQFKGKGYFIDLLVDEYGFRFLGSISLIQAKYKLPHYDISVYDIRNNKMRDLDSSNFDDDTDIGMIYFSKEVTHLLNEYYYFAGLSIYDRINPTRNYVIDILENKVMIFEGEFNKFPKKIKEIILPYNIKTLPVEPFMSDAMYDWQLMASWEFEQKMNPVQKLSNKLWYEYNDIYKQLDIIFIDIENEQQLRENYDKLKKVFQSTISNSQNQKTFKSLNITENQNLDELNRDLCEYILGFLDE